MSDDVVNLFERDNTSRLTPVLAEISVTSVAAARTLNTLLTGLDIDAQRMRENIDLTAINDAINVYYNYSGQVECVKLGSDAYPDGLGHGWDYQTCTEMTIPFCFTGTTLILFLCKFVQHLC